MVRGLVDGSIDCLDQHLRTFIISNGEVSEIKRSLERITGESVDDTIPIVIKGKIIVVTVVIDCESEAAKKLPLLGFNCL